MNDLVGLIKNFFTDYPYEYAVVITQPSFFVKYGSLIGGAASGSFIVCLFNALGRKTKSRLEIAIFSLGFFSSFALAFVAIPLNTQFNSAQKTNNNIEIIRPYVSEEQYTEFRSDFYQIKTKKEYESFVLDLKKAAKPHDLSLQ